MRKSSPQKVNLTLGGNSRGAVLVPYKTILVLLNNFIKNHNINIITILRI